MTSTWLTQQHARLSLDQDRSQPTLRYLMPRQDCLASQIFWFWLIVVEPLHLACKLP